MSWIRIALFVVLTAFIAEFSWAGVGLFTQEPSKKDVLSIIPGAVRFEHLEDPIDYYKIFDSTDNRLGVVVVTTRVPPAVGGYLDEISLLVGVDNSGKITGIKLLAHQENQEYINQILSKGFLNRIINLNPAENWKDIETVTGATISADAIRDDVRTASAAVVEKVLKSGVIKKEAAAAKTPGFEISKKILESAAVIFLSLLSLAAAYMPGRRHLRIASLVLSFLVIGLLLNTPVTIANFVDLFRRALPSLSNLPLSILLIFAVISSFIKGPVYCTYLCPFGAAQEGMGSFGGTKLSIDGKWMARAAFLRWIVLFVAVAAILFFKIGAFRKIEPFALCFSFYKGNPVWPLVGIILLVAFFVRRPWCRLFCPTGLMVELLSKIGGKARLKFLKTNRLPNIGEESAGDL